MALYTFNDNFKINAPKHIDTRYINLFTPYASTAQVNSTIPIAYRYLGLTVLIGVTEWWYQAGVTDPDLVPKVGGIASITADNGLTLTGSNMQLGGTIIHDTLLDTTGTNWKIYINADSNSVSPFIVSNSGVAPAILGQATGGPSAAIAIKGVAGAGNIAVYASATGVASVSLYAANGIGIAGYFTATVNGGAGVSILTTNNASPLIAVSDFQPVLFETNNANTNAVITGLEISRNTTTGANGIGTSIQFNITDSTSALRESNNISSKFTNATGATADSQLVFTGYRNNVRTDMMLIGVATQMGLARFETHEGASVAAANNLTLGLDGNMFLITGNTQINAITLSNWQSSSEVGLVFTGTPLVKNNTAGGGGTAPLLLSGGVDYLAASGDYIAFRYDASFGVWHETARKLAGGGSAGVFSANNGLSLAPIVSNVQMGGSFIQNTTITAGANHLDLTGATGLATLNIDNSNNAGQAFNVTVTGTGTVGIFVDAQGVNGVGGYFNATGVSSTGLVGVGGNIGIVAQSFSPGGSAMLATMANAGGQAVSASAFQGSVALYARVTSLTNNDVITIGQFYRDVTPPSLADNGVGGSIDYQLQDNLGLVHNFVEFQWTATDVIPATYTGQLVINIANSAVINPVLTLSGNGRARLNKYGVGNFTAGTPVYTLQVDASGNIMEGSGGGGGGFTTADNGLTASTATNIQLGGTLLHNTVIDTTPIYQLQVIGDAAALKVQSYDIGSNNNVASLIIERIGSSTPGGIFGTSIDFYLNNTGGSSVNCYQLMSSWIISSAGNEYGVMSISGKYAGSPTTWFTTDGGSTQSYGVNYGFITTFASIGIYAQSTTTPGEFINNSTATNSINQALSLERTGVSGTPGAGLGISVSYKIISTTLALREAAVTAAAWTTATDASRSAQFLINGTTNAIAGTQWADFSGIQATFYGTSVGVLTANANTGVQAQGTTTGVYAESLVQPLWANNRTTVTNTVVNAILLQRAGTYNAAAGAGLQLYFQMNNGSGSLVTTGYIVNKITSPTAGAVYSGFEFYVKNNNSDALALTIKGTQIINIAVAPAYANNAAAISGGLSVGDCYQNGDLVGRVH